jgi:hypothetical protein
MLNNTLTERSRRHSLSQERNDPSTHLGWSRCREVVDSSHCSDYLASGANQQACGGEAFPLLPAPPHSAWLIPQRASPLIR